MTITCTPDSGIPMPPEDALEPDLVESTQAACNTIELLKEEGLEVTPDDMDKGVVADIIEEFAASEDRVERPAAAKVLAKTPPSAIVLARDILDAFSHSVVNRAVEIRHLVTNKLIIESDNPDPKVRLRALELLGKISDVGLFTERSEVIVTHQSSSELEERLREKLRKIMNPEGIEDVNVVEINGEALNIGRELGLETESASA